MPILDRLRQKAVQREEEEAQRSNVASMRQIKGLGAFQNTPLSFLCPITQVCARACVRRCVFLCVCLCVWGWGVEAWGRRGSVLASVHM